MELLELAEGLDNVVVKNKLLGLLTEAELNLVVLLEVEVTKFLVYADEVVEVLDVEVIGLPEILHILLRH